MNELPPAVTLDLWDAAEGLAPVERALALAAAAEPRSSPEELAALALGRRDARLLRLRLGLAGGTLEATAACPSCAEPVELSLDVARLLEREHGAAPAPVAIDGIVVTWRPLDSRDVAAAAAAGDAAAAERVLLERCVLSAEGSEGPVEPAVLPPGARAALARALADADPLAEVLLDLTCPACGSGFVADLALAEFVWTELHVQAQRLLHEVGELARAFGWSEDEVLILGPRRRAAYLRLARERVE